LFWVFATLLVLSLLVAAAVVGRAPTGPASQRTLLQDQYALVEAFRGQLVAIPSLVEQPRDVSSFASNLVALAGVGLQDAKARDDASLETAWQEALQASKLLQTTPSTDVASFKVALSSLSAVGDTLALAVSGVNVGPSPVAPGPQPDRPVLTLPEVSSPTLVPMPTTPVSTMPTLSTLVPTTTTPASA
jgi:hypothetical protein